MTDSSSQRYGTVFNVLDVDVGDGFSLGGGWRLGRPTVEQVDQIRPLFQNLDNATNTYSRRTAPPHEYIVTGNQSSGASQSFQLSISPDEWRYLIVSRTDPDGLDADALVQALLLSDAGIYADFWPNGEPARRDGKLPRILNPTAAAMFSLQRSASATLLPAAPDLQEVREVVSLRSTFSDSAYPDIVRLIGQFVETHVIPIRYSQSALAHLGIIEGLITHKPGSQNSRDSITKQLKRNIVAIGENLPSHRSFELDRFGTASPEEVISKLYAYRSAIAHGSDTADSLRFFEQYRWHAPDHPHIELHEYTRRLLKQLLLFTLMNPDFVRALK